MRQLKSDELSPHAKKLVELLNTRRDPRPKEWRFWFSRKPFERDFVAELLATNEPAVIPHVLPSFFLQPRRSETDVRMLAALMARLSFIELIALDARIRESWRMNFAPIDANVSIEESGSDAVVLVGLLSFVRNGYFREAAVEQLASFQDGRELPFLLLRLADWVPQVRDAATRVLAARTRIENIEAFIANLPLIAHVRRRAPHSKIEALDELLGGAEARPLLIRALSDGSISMQRAAFEILVQRPAADFAIAVSNATDFVVRSRAIRLIVATLPNGDAAALVEKLARDRSPAIRRDALTTLATLAPDRAKALLPAALFDRSRGVREIARLMLRSDGVDFAAMYRDALIRSAPNSSTRQLATAIAALAEAGARSDAAVVLPHLRNPRTGVRTAAIRALRQLGGDDVLPHIVPLLADPSKAVSAAARDVLRPRAHNLDGAQLWQLFTDAKLRHVRLNVLEVITELPKWKSIRRLIDAVRDEDDVVAEIARCRIARWMARYNRNNASPTAAEIGEVTAALEAAKDQLPASAAREIAFSLQAFR